MPEKDCTEECESCRHIDFIIADLLILKSRPDVLNISKVNHCTSKFVA